MSASYRGLGITVGRYSEAVTAPHGNVHGADPADFTTTYTYDFDGNRVRTSHPYPGGGTVTNDYGFDQLGRPTSNTDSLGRTESTGYDNDSNVVSQADPLGGTTTYSYDANGRPTATVAAAGGTTGVSYDAADPSGVRTQDYDSAGRLASVSRGDQSFGYRYDTDGNVTSRTWPDGTTVDASFDAGDNVSSLTVQGGQAGPDAARHTFGYDPSGRLDRTTYPTADHLVTDRTYDPAGRLSGLDSHTDTGTVAGYQVTRDPVGNPTGITTTRGDTSQHVAYTYDDSDGVTAACVGPDCASAAPAAYHQTRIALRDQLGMDQPFLCHTVRSSQPSPLSSYIRFSNVPLSSLS